MQIIKPVKHIYLYDIEAKNGNKLKLNNDIELLSIQNTVPNCVEMVDISNLTVLELINTPFIYELEAYSSVKHLKLVNSKCKTVLKFGANMKSIILSDIKFIDQPTLYIKKDINYILIDKSLGNVNLNNFIGVKKVNIDIYCKI